MGRWGNGKGKGRGGRMTQLILIFDIRCGGWRGGGGLKGECLPFYSLLFFGEERLREREKKREVIDPRKESTFFFPREKV